MSPIPVSGEVGNVDASTVVVTWSSVVLASDYLAGVTITVNGDAAALDSATRQGDHHVIYYALGAPVQGGDVVQFSYNDATGNYLDDLTMMIGNPARGGVLVPNPGWAGRGRRR